MIKFIKYIISIGAVVLLLVAIAYLNVAIQDNNKTISKTSSASSTRLNVAIVNEDKAVISGNKTYNLGNSYIKKLEKDDRQNWSVVTRGTADSGDYQLIVIIPNDFSSKILDLDSLSAEKVTINYEVKSDGNQQIETEAVKVGKDIVSDLKNQLVDLYMASILSNLYTAQQNVQVLSNQQSDNISSYQDNLLGSAVNFKDNLPVLATTADGSLTANNNLLQSLSRFSLSYNLLETSQQTFSNDLRSLVEKRANDRISYEDFVSSLISVDGETLSTNLKTMTGILQEEQAKLEKLTSEVSTANTNNGTSKDVQNQVDSLTKQITDLESQLSEQDSILQAQKDNIQQFAKDVVSKYYGSNIRVADFLNQTKSSDPNSHYLATTPEAYKKTLQSSTQSAINKLQVIDAGGISNLAANMTYLDPNAANSLNNFDTKLANEFQAVASFTPSGLSDELSAARARLDNAKRSFESGGNSQTGPVPGANTSGTTVVAKVTLNLPSRAGFVLDSWSYNGVDYTGRGTQNVEVTLSNSSSSDNGFQFTYHYDTATGGTAPTTSADTDVIAVNINGVTATTADIRDYQNKESEYRTAESSYATKVQEVKDAYANAETLLEQYYATDSFLNQSVADLVTDMVVKAIMANLTDYSDKSSSNTTSLYQQVENLKKKRDAIASQLSSLQDTNTYLSNSLTAQIASFQTLQEQITSVKTKEPKVSSALSDSDSTLSTLSSTLSSLLSSTSELKTTSEFNAEEANQVNRLLSSFNGDVKTTQSNSNKLATDAQNLMNNFSKELKDSNDFVGSFTKVLGNTYNNGVANEGLLDFLSNPVTESSSSVKATTEAYKPFTWILLLEIVTLFTSYIFATYNIVQKVKDKFNINKLQETDIINTGVISILAIVIGVSLGIIAASKLTVARELVPSWILIVTLFSLILTQSQYLLIKNFKALGMGFSLFMTISFVYLSNAIGTTATLTGFPANMKKMNVLSLLENTLSSYFDGKSTSLFLLFGSILVVILLIGANIFVTLDWRKFFKNVLKTGV